MSKFNKSQIMKSAWNHARNQARLNSECKKFIFGKWIVQNEGAGQRKASEFIAEGMRQAWDDAKTELELANYSKISTMTLDTAKSQNLNYSNVRFCTIEMVEMGEAPQFEGEMIVDAIAA